MNYTQGDIVIVPVPFTDNERYKLRPAIVISNEIVHKTDDVMIVQITSKFKDDGLNLILTDEHVTELLPVKSYVRVHKVFVLEKHLIKGKVSSLKKEKYKELIDRIQRIIKIPE